MTASTADQRVGIYLRVSTLNQEIETQLLQLRVLCEQQGWRVTKEYVDVESGRKCKRERSDFGQRDCKVVLGYGEF